jgi:glycosyltransferase involved in cell wall biosynthesis
MISVVLATYNRAGLLMRAIQSVKSQSTDDWELVIVDDGSTDNTLSAIQPFLPDPRITYFAQTNAGLALARNAGMQRSRGELITFLDSDDEYKPDHLKLRLRYFEQYPATDLLHGGVEIVGGPDYVRDVNDSSRHIPLADCFIGGTFVMRRRVFEILGGFRPPDFGTDYELAQRAMEQHFTIAKTNDPTYVYHRETPDGLCNLMEKSCRS